MAIPTLKINGRDWTWILLENSIKWSRNDLDSDKAGRTLDGKMHRNRVAIKRKIEISGCKRLTTQQMALLNQDIMPETVTVSFLDAITGAVYTGTFYGSTVNAAIMSYDPLYNETYWEDYSFNLTEV